MKRFYFEPTSYCQLKCPLCPTPRFTGDRKGHMDISKFEALMKSASAEGFFELGDEVHFYGFGEPLLNQKLSNMIEISSQYGLSSKINTNGLLLKPELANRLDGAGLNKVLISMDGITSEDYLKYRVNGNFDTLVANLEYLATMDRHFSVELQFILFNYNEGRELELIEFGKEYGVDTVVLKKPRFWDEKDENSSLLDSSATREKSDKLCRFGKDYGLVMWNGNLTICNSDPHGKNMVGNIFEQGVSLWRSPEFIATRCAGEKLSLPTCHNCGYNNLYSRKVKVK
jgi:MoaA/NifB/PqqE/SkfB family radical SAM enzyme